MRILLIGEFSSFHQNLMEGLIALGHDVTLASNGDGKRNFYRDIDLKPYSIKILNKKISIFPNRKCFFLKNFDVVQLIYPILFSTNLHLNSILRKEIIKKNKKVFLVSTGSDIVFYNKGKYKLEYNPLDDWMKYDRKGKKLPFKNNFEEKSFSGFISKINGIIPTMYEYKLGYTGCNNLKKIIPLPLNINKLNYSPNVIRGKIKFLHIANRPGFKGSRYILKAFEYLINKYPNDIEFIYSPSLPFEKYLSLVEKCNIIVDQTNSYSWGYNALIPMAMGRIAMSGCEGEALTALSLTSAPIINIKPDVEHIVFQVEKLMKKKNKIGLCGKLSREFVANHHNYIDIAKKYIQTWCEV